jgi:hypothetical protein
MAAGLLTLAGGAGLGSAVAAAPFVLPAAAAIGVGAFVYSVLPQGQKASVNEAVSSAAKFVGEEFKNLVGAPLKMSPSSSPDDATDEEAFDTDGVTDEESFDLNSEVYDPHPGDAGFYSKDYVPTAEELAQSKKWFKQDYEASNDPETDPESDFSDAKMPDLF